MRSCTLVKIDESARKDGLKDWEIRYAVRHPFGFQKNSGQSRRDDGRVRRPQA